MRRRGTLCHAPAPRELVVFGLPRARATRGHLQEVPAVEDLRPPERIASSATSTQMAEDADRQAIGRIMSEWLRTRSTSVPSAMPDA
jgi:hypothetical protein